MVFTELPSIRQKQLFDADLIAKQRKHDVESRSYHVYNTGSPEGVRKIVDEEDIGIEDDDIEDPAYDDHTYGEEATADVEGRQDLQVRGTVYERCDERSIEGVGKSAFDAPAHTDHERVK